MANFEIITKSVCVTNLPDSRYLIIKKNPLIKTDAGIVDKLITEKMGVNFISREEGRVNGVTVSQEEIVIGLSKNITNPQKSEVLGYLEALA